MACCYPTEGEDESMGYLKNNPALITLILLLLLSGLSGCAIYPRAGAAHSGWVLDADTGEPVAGVYVIRHTHGSKYMRDYEVTTEGRFRLELNMTDQDGHYEFSPFTPEEPYRNSEGIEPYKIDYDGPEEHWQRRRWVDRGGRFDPVVYVRYDPIHKTKSRTSGVPYSEKGVWQVYPVNRAIDEQHRKWFGRSSHNICLTAKGLNWAWNSSEIQSCDIDDVPLSWKAWEAKLKAKAKTSSGHLPPNGQQCRSQRWKKKHAKRFKRNADGTVTDSLTGLSWWRCAEGQRGGDCVGKAEAMTWYEAAIKASSTDHGGHTDWRLPRLDELKTLVVEGCYGPSIDLALFPNTPSWYFWSSTDDDREYRKGDYWAFVDTLSFGYGDEGTGGSDDDYHYVRFVRGPKWTKPRDR